MVSFLLSFAFLILGYVIYGKIVEKIFAPDPQRLTPAVTMNDGVDYIPMTSWRVYLIQFLNIAGTGPIFGAIQGILFGPSAYLWIVLGCVFGGAVHDYFSGVISLRKNGASLPEIVGDELGNSTRVILRVMALFLMVLVGAVFTTTPAGLLANICTSASVLGNAFFWTIIIILYYILATLLPIDKIIGKIYPIFGVVLLFMAVAIFFGIFYYDGFLPELTDAFTNHHPATTLPIFPGICITIACGAVSGFHATQSPMMARCTKNERLARPIFYGAMITEGLVALIWAAGAIKFASLFGVAGATPYEQLWNAMTENGAHGANPAIIVKGLCVNWFGMVGGIIAILGVICAPITTGDTAFRCARLIAADFLKIKQNKIKNRILLCLPIFACAIFLMCIDFQILWRYFAWFNQTFSIFTFWAITVWLVKHDKCFWVSLIPALWMTMVSVTYILVAPEGFQLDELLAKIIGGVVTIAILSWFIVWRNKYLQTSN